ncbi:MAG: hypothetical protein PUD38_05000 [Firmicutes bacterium]|nr:hypothetical protein [Bacillota bacterium]
MYFTLIFGFLLGVSDGYIALWKDGNAQPLRVFPYRAELLPVADRQALERGIPLTDESELMRLLEDYLS